METPADWIQEAITSADGAALPLPWARRAPITWARPLLQAPVFAALDLVVPQVVEGRAHLDGLTPPVLFVANHASHLDSPVVLAALPAAWRRQVAVAAAADYFFARPRLGATIAGVFNAFPFARNGGVRAPLETCARLMHEGWSVLIYPEGTRTTTGTMGPFHAGVGVLAVELGVPVVPVGLSGLFAVMPRETRVPHPARVTVRFGGPLYFEHGTSYKAAAAAMAATVHSLCEPASGPVRPMKGVRHAGYVPY